MGHEAVLPYLKTLPKLEHAVLFGLEKKSSKTKIYIAFCEKEKVPFYSLLHTTVIPSEWSRLPAYQ